MSTIKSLPLSTIKLLKSSQVILSVSSLVKELIENALDAGATIISVKLENGGLHKIEVRDNGCGVSPEDVQVMAQPHYTSKLQTHDDLQRLSTYGFRGEALAAICSVSSFSVITKRDKDEFSTTYIMNPNGEVKEHKISNLGTGTSIVVENLFKNLPVRRKQLQDPKHSKRELKLIEDLLLAYTIIHPTIYATLHHNHHIIWQKPRTCTLKDSLAHHFSRPLVQHLAFLQKKTSEVSVELCLPAPSAPVELCFRQKPDRFFLFVNNRPVVDKDFVEVIKEAYRSQGAFNDSLFPIGVLSIQVASTCLDVNLEPSKTRVLFSNKEIVKDLIRTTLLEQWSIKEPEVRVENPLSRNELVNTRTGLTPVKKDVRNGAVLQQFDEFDFQKRAAVDTHLLPPNTLQPVACQPRNEPQRVQSKSTPVKNTVGTEVQQFHAQKQTVMDTHLLPPNPPFLANVVNSNALLVTEPGLTSFPVKRGMDDLDSWSRGNVTTNGKPLNPVGLLRDSTLGAKDDSFAPKPKRSKLSLYPPQPKLDAFLRDRRQKHRTEVILPSTKDSRISDRADLTVEKTLMDFFSRGEKPVEENFLPRGQVPSTASKTKEISLKPTEKTKIFEKRTVSRKIVPIDFSLSSLSSELNEQRSGDNTRVVGQIEGLWLVYRHQNLAMWNHHRMQEIMLYRHLVAEWEIPSWEHKDFPVIDANSLGYELWSVLLSLESEFDSDTTSNITDKRLTSNGYCLQITEASLSYATALRTPSYLSVPEIDDLKGILRHICQNPLCSLEESRTQAGKECCQTEAQRLSQTPEASCNEETEFLELLEAYVELREQVSSQLSRCFHDKEVEFTLGSLDSLSCGQEDSSNFV